MIPYHWRRAWRVLQGALRARKVNRFGYLIVELATGHAVARPSLYALRSPGGFAAVMRDLRIHRDGQVPSPPVQ